mmetsp:Transcript_9457/g.17730  ORF Transcript_9457/g.17730 Transcript_9457/m.17730 type:complete len:152 (-) Transcript_9457:66-521(-)
MDFIFRKVQSNVFMHFLILLHLSYIQLLFTHASPFSPAHLLFPIFFRAFLSLPTLLSHFVFRWQILDIISSLWSNLKSQKINDRVDDFLTKEMSLPLSTIPWPPSEEGKETKGQLLEVTNLNASGDLLMIKNSINNTAEKTFCQCLRFCLS